MNAVNTEFSYAEVWFTDQSSKALENEDQQNQNLENMLKDMAFCLLLETLEINIVKN